MYLHDYKIKCLSNSLIFRNILAYTFVFNSPEKGNRLWDPLFTHGYRTEDSSIGLQMHACEKHVWEPRGLQYYPATVFYAASTSVYRIMKTEMGPGDYKQAIAIEVCSSNVDVA
jgi:hypothetical protein